MIGLAWRNVIRQGRRSLLLGGAVGFGVLVTSLAGALTTGFYDTAVDHLSLSLGGHLRIAGYEVSASGRRQNRMPLPTEAELESLRRTLPGVLSVSPQASTSATVVFGSREVRLPLLGVDGPGWDLFRRGLSLTEGGWESTTDRGLIVDSVTYARLGAGIGDEVLVRLVTASGQQNLTEYRIQAVFDQAASGGRAGALVAFSDMRDDLNLGPDEAPALVLTWDDPSQAPGAADLLRNQGMMVHSHAEIVTVQDTMGSLATVLGTLRILGWVLLAMMLGLIAGGVSNTFRMVLLERVREIGTLRCLGMQRRGVLVLFLLEAALVAGGGGLAGAGLSLPVGALLAVVPPGWTGAAALVLRQGHLPVGLDWGTMGFSLLAVVTVAVGSAWGSARKAAAWEPARALASTS